MQKRILHITPHLGGGVGSVILAWMEEDISKHIHTIISLDKNNNKDWIRIHNDYENVNIFDNTYANDNFEYLLSTNINNNDIVLIHWWNHPLLYDILINCRWPPCRILIWNHVNSLFPPYTMPEKLIDFADYLIFTSPVSYECAELKRWTPEQKGKTGVLWSTIGINAFENLKRESHDGFIVGYTGTVDYGKLNQNFIELCANVTIPDVQFVVCSGDSQRHLLDEVEKRGISNKFSFEGRVPSILPYLAKFDVFGYPLQPQHFATCEQSLGEAMMAGCVPVVLSNPTEKHIIKHMKTGIVAETLEEYPRAIEYLYHNQDILKRLSENARIFAKKQYDINKTISGWNDLFDKSLFFDKKNHIWGGGSSGLQSRLTPAMLYIESLGEAHSLPLVQYTQAKNDTERNKAIRDIKQLFDSNSMFYSNNKGSVLQYLNFFPQDKILQKWAKIADKN
jgi:glycosyltransferase involved in cell wall biosynthesis